MLRMRLTSIDPDTRKPRDVFSGVVKIAAKRTNRLNMTTLTSGCLFNFRAALIQKIDYGLNEREDAISICGAAMKPITFVFSDRGGAACQPPRWKAIEWDETITMVTFEVPVPAIDGSLHRCKTSTSSEHLNSRVTTKSAKVADSSP